jgi:hypothetical protein
MLARLCWLGLAFAVSGLPATVSGAAEGRREQPIRFIRQSAVMPASFTTFAHSAMSDLMLSAN